MLAALGQHYHWSRAELEGLTAQEAAFWAQAASDFHAVVKKAAETA